MGAHKDGIRYFSISVELSIRNLHAFDLVAFSVRAHFDWGDDMFEAQIFQPLNVRVNDHFVLISDFARAAN